MQIGLAVLGAAVGLAGLSLVFLGFALSTYQSFAADAGETVMRPYRVSAWVMTYNFVVGAIVAVVVLIALMSDSSKAYHASLGMFFYQLIGSGVSATVITNLTLRGRVWL